MNRIVRGTLMSLGLVTALVTGIAAAPAQADTYYDGRTYYGHQPYGYQAPSVAYRAPLGERQIDWRLQRQGFRQVGPLRYERGVILTRAVDNWGRHVRLTVSPVTGQVIGTRFIR
ncbi:MAG: hypothetical protein IT563_10540 [Alphaproteobacteria bacterium]|nr:hypothetical protein [Alphaproteobacteria bacterium]